MSSKTLNKVKIIYDRLYSEYNGGWDGVGEFSEKLGVSRQGLKYRKDNQSIDYDEIVRLFPEVNRVWLLSTNEEELRNLPVKNVFTGKSEGKDILDKDIRQRASDISILVKEKGIQYKDRVELIEVLQSRADTLSRELAEFSLMIGFLSQSDD